MVREVRLQPAVSGGLSLASPRRGGGQKEDGAEDWNRTSDTSIFSAVLYRLSYLGTANRRMAER
jgi:hypothetical protein